MSRILGNNSDNPAVERRGVKGLVVRGLRFVNSAAKFWPSMIDEVAEDYPDCDTIVFDMLTDPILDRNLLFPVNALQQEWDRRQGQLDIQEVLRDALTQFDMIGPPGAVHVKLLAGTMIKKTCDLPLDCVDADIFPCLVVWLLEWSEISDDLWNNPVVRGDFCARDRERTIRYRFQFDLVNKHISEGLFQRILTMRYTRWT
jgi:hypothetical protein